MNKKPLISILMNCFNGELYLREALDSLIRQSYQNWELIFWNNQSTDKSLEIISKYNDKRIKIFNSKKHTNLGEAREKAFAKTKGEYLAFLDVDDIWEKDKLKLQLEVFRNKEIGISFTNTKFFSTKREENLFRTNQNLKVSTRSLITNYPIALVSIMIDINKLNSLSYSFDKNFSHISDFDLIVRVSTISKVKYLDKVLCGWRIHYHNESFKKKELFNKEIERWCDFHLENKYLEKFTKEIKELRLLTLARNRIVSSINSSISLKEMNFNSLSNLRNQSYIFFSYIPIIPKAIYKIKEIIFKLKWYKI